MAKTAAEQLRENAEAGRNWEVTIEFELNRTMPDSYSREQAHGGSRLDFAVEDAAGDRIAVVEAKSGGWNDKGQADRMVTLAEDTRTKTLVTIGDADKFDPSVTATIEQAQQSGRITWIHVPPDKVGAFADKLPEWSATADATPDRNCPQLGKDFQAEWDRELFQVDAPEARNTSAPQPNPAGNLAGGETRIDAGVASQNSGASQVLPTGGVEKLVGTNPGGPSAPTPSAAPTIPAGGFFERPR